MPCSVEKLKIMKAKEETKKQMPNDKFIQLDDVIIMIMEQRTMTVDDCSRPDA